MSEEGQNIGTARIDVVVNTDRMDAAVDSAKTRISGMSAQAQADYAALSAAQKRATDSALTQADAIGKSREEMTLYKASLKGLPVSILDELKTKIVASQVAANEASVAIAAMGSGLGKSALPNNVLLKVNQSLAAYKEQSAAQADLAAQTAVEDQARIEQEVRWQAFLRESAAEKIAINEAVATSNVEASASAGNDAAAFNAAVLRKNAALTELNTAMAAGIPDIAALTEANVQLDVAMAAGALSAREQQAYITTLNAAEERLTGVKIGETVATEANTVATNANTVAKGMNSRIAYSASALISDAASGQLGRSKRELAALANETGLLSKLFTPVGIAIGATAGAVGLLGVAAYKAAEAQTELEQAITRSGNAAGLDAEQIKQLATQYATYHTSAKQVVALQEQLMTTGAATVSTFKQATQAAVVFGEATGESNKQVIQTFDEIAKNPLQTLDRINQVYGNITPKIRDHVKALLDEGDKLDAVAAAYQAIIDTMGHTADMEHAQEGLIDRLVARWNHGAAAIGEAYSKLVNGLSLTDQFQLAKSTYEAHLKSTARNSPLDRFGGQVFSNSELQAEHDQVKAIADQIQKIRDAAALGGQATEDNKAGNAANSYYDAHFAKLDKIKEKQKEINDLTATYEQMWEHTGSENARLNGVQRIVDANGKASFAGGNFDNDLAGIEAKFKEKKARGGSTSDPFASLDGLVQTAQVNDNNFGTDNKQTQQVQAILKIVDAGAKLIASGKDVVRAQDEVAKGVEAVNSLYGKQAAQITEKNVAANRAYQASLDDMLETRKAQSAFQIQSIGLSQKEVQQQKELFSIQEDYNKRIEALNKEHDDKSRGLDDASYKVRRTLIEKFRDDSIAAEKSKAAGMESAQANGIAGMKAAIKDYIDEQNNMARQSYQFTQSFIQGFGGAFSSFITGTESAKKAFGSFIDDMYKQSVAFLANQAIKALFKSFASKDAGGDGSGWAGLLGNLLGGISGGGSVGPGTIGAGLATGGPVAPGSFHPVNENGPELYTTSGKTYLMAGSEPGQVTPITSGRGAVTVNQTIVVSGLINRQTQDQLSQRAAQRQRVAMARNG